MIGPTLRQSEDQIHGNKLCRQEKSSHIPQHPHIFHSLPHPHDPLMDQHTFRFPKIPSPLLKGIAFNTDLHHWEEGGGGGALNDVAKRHRQKQTHTCQPNMAWRSLGLNEAYRVIRMWFIHKESLNFAASSHADADRIIHTSKIKAAFTQ